MVRIQKIINENSKKTVFNFKDLKLRLNNINIVDLKNIIVSNENGIHNVNIINNTSKSNFNIKNTITLNNDSDNIFVGTTKDFFILNKELKIIKKFNLNIKINSISYDKNSKDIYLTTQKGIIFLKYNKNSYILKQIINEYDGLLNKKIKKTIPKTNNLLVLYDTGYSLIDKEIFKEKLIGKVEILSFKANDSSFNYNKKIRLKRDFNTIIIENSVKTKNNNINFNKFYKLSNNKWVKFNEVNLKFNELKPGDYTLKIGLKAIGSDKFLNTQTVNFEVLPSFLESEMFLYLIIFFTILTTLFLSNLFLKKRKEKNLIKDKLNSLEIKAIKSQMNPHFIFNSLNNIQSSFLLEDVVKSNQIFINFSKLLRTTLEMVNSDFTTLKKELNYIKEYLSVIQSNHDANIDLVFNIDENIDLSKIKIPVLILQPIVENAIEHGLIPSEKEKKLQINIFKNTNSSIKIEIIDNGVGRKNNNLKNTNKQQSFGTSIIENRLELLKKINSKKTYSFKIIDLIENSISIGTKVIITIPEK